MCENYLISTKKNRLLSRFNEFQFLFILEWTNKAKQWSRIFRNLCCWLDLHLTGVLRVSESH